MKRLNLNITLLILFLFFNCNMTNSVPFTESEILEQLDLPFKFLHNPLFSIENKLDIKYYFILDLEHGYCETASSRIHLYADKNRWAIVTEKAGYQNRAGDAEIELNYFGNCINYPGDIYSGQKAIENTSRLILISGEEYEKIENKEGTENETFEFISPTAKELQIRDKTIVIEHDLNKYLKVGIKPKEPDNPRKLISFGDIVMYLNETNPEVISAKEKEIREHIPQDLPKLMTIDKFHYASLYDKNNLPSKQETYKLIAKVLVSLDTTIWKPTLKPNNHWSNWESGNL